MMKNILDEFYRKDHYAFHKISQAINDYGGHMTIKLLTNHSNVSISSVAHELTKYGGNNCAKCHQTKTIESMMQQ